MREREGEKKEGGLLPPPSATHRGPRGAPWPLTAAGDAWLRGGTGHPKKRGGKRRVFGLVMEKSSGGGGDGDFGGDFRWWWRN